MEQVVAAEVAVAVDARERPAGPVDLGHGDRPVEGDDRCRARRATGRRGGRSAASRFRLRARRRVHRLDAAWSWYGPGGAAEAGTDERCPSSISAAVPEGAVLVGQQDSSPSAPVRAARRDSMRSRSASSPTRLGLVGHQLDQSRASRMASAHRSSRTSGRRRRGVALAEDQVDHGEHARRRSGRSASRDAVRDARVADLRLGARQPLRHRRLRHQEGARDLGGGQAAEQAQGQRDARRRRQRVGGHAVVGVRGALHAYRRHDGAARADAAGRRGGVVHARGSRAAALAEIERGWAAIGR